MLIEKELLNSLLEFVNEKWITIHPNGEDGKGRHILIKDGETLSDAMHRAWGVQPKTGQQKLDFKGAEKKAKEEEAKKKEAPKQEAKKGYTLSEDYKKMVSGYTPALHKLSIETLGKDMAKYASKANAGINKDDGGKQYDEYSAKFEEVKSKREYHEQELKRLEQQEPKKQEGTKENKHITKDNYGRTIVNKPNSNKKVKISKNGDYYLASYGQELKEPDGYTEFQVFPSASGKTFKTEKGAVRWAEKILEINSNDNDKKQKKEIKIPKAYQRNESTKNLWLYKNGHISEKEWQKRQRSLLSSSMGYQPGTTDHDEGELPF